MSADGDAGGPRPGPDVPAGDRVHAPLVIDDLRRARQAARIGRTIHYFERVTSTNDVAAALARDGAAEGVAVIAETQTRGRGRRGRAWVSPPLRNLYISVVLRPPIAVDTAPQVGLVVGLATAEAVRQWVPRATIKWPNDVLIDGRKVAGVLMELEGGPREVTFVVAGIGVNLNSTAADFPPEVRDKAISVCAAAGRHVDRVAFAACLLSTLQERYDRFVDAGFAPLRTAWEGLSCLTGRSVTIEDGGERSAGIVTGIGDDGALRLRGTSDREIRVVAGDVTVVDGYSVSDQPPTSRVHRRNDGRSSRA